MSFVAVDNVLKGEAEMRSSNVVANLIKKSLKHLAIVVLVISTLSVAAYGRGKTDTPKNQEAITKSIQDIIDTTIQQKSPFEFISRIKHKIDSLKDAKKKDDFIKNFNEALEKSSLDKNKKEALKTLFNDLINGKTPEELIDSEAAKLIREKSASEAEKKLMEKYEQLRQAFDNLVRENEAKAQQTPNQPSTGEVDNSALMKLVLELCKNELNNRKRGNIDEKIQPLKDALNEIFNQVKALSRRPVEDNKDKNALEDILPELLKNLMKPEEEKESGDKPESPSSSGGSPEQEKGKSPFDQPLPEPKEDEKLPPQQEMPPMFPIQPKNEQPKPISLNLPTNTGRRELRDAQDTLAELESRTPITNTLIPGAGLAELVMAKAKVQGEKERAQSVLQAAKDRLNRLDEQIEELKEGGEAALPSWVKRHEAELEAKIKKYDNAIEQTQQAAQQAAKNPQAIAYIQARVQQLNQLKSKAEEDLARFRAEKEAKIEEANKGIKKLAKSRDALQSVVSKLEGQIKNLKEEESAIQQMIQQQMQLQLQMLQGNTGSPVRTVTQPQGAGMQPRTQAPGVGPGFGTNAPTTTGGSIRGPLGK